MPKRGIRDRQKERYWRKVQYKFNQSGVSAPIFCRDENLKYSQFSDWRKVIRKHDEENERRTAEAKEKFRRRHQTELQPAAAANNKRGPEFAPVHLIEGPMVDLLACNRVLDFVLNDQLTLRVGVDCPPEFHLSIISMLGRL